MPVLEIVLIVAVLIIAAALGYLLTPSIIRSIRSYLHHASDQEDAAENRSD